MYVADVLMYVYLQKKKNESFYQFLAILKYKFFLGLLIGGGVAIYPHGWTSMEVQQACGNLSGSYKFGKLSLPKHTSPQNINSLLIFFKGLYMI